MTRFTAAPGMLVRKGSYVHLDALQMALFTEVRGAPAWRYLERS